MKSFGVWVALGVLCVGIVGSASCGDWPLLSGPKIEEVQTSSAGGGGVGGVGTGGAGTAGSSTGGGGAAPGCGDGEIKSSETCDDGNQKNGDGCSSTCQEEECWDCMGVTCTELAPNTPCNNGAQVCDGDGKCGDCVPADVVCNDCKSCAGSPCNKDGDCASMACVTGVCRSANGSTCVESVECASNYCTGGVCAACSANDQCTNGACDMMTGQCSAVAGEPCDASMPCGGGLNCTSINICKWNNGKNCTADYECVSNFCQAGKCASCMINGDCVSGQCQGGVCSGGTLPEGSYCVDDSGCLSSNCTGFPRKCAPPMP